VVIGAIPKGLALCTALPWQAETPNCPSLTSDPHPWPLSPWEMGAIGKIESRFTSGGVDFGTRWHVLAAGGDELEAVIRGNSSNKLNNA